MKEKLRARLPKVTEAELDAICSILETYDIEPTIRNFDGLGFRLLDDKGRSVRVRVGQWRDKKVHLAHPEADITVVIVDGMIAGWTPSDKLEDADDRCIADLKSLSPMPQIFSFDQQCAHLVVHGGLYEGEHWICFGCGRSLIFNDK